MNFIASALAYPQCRPGGEVRPWQNRSASKVAIRLRFAFWSITPLSHRPSLIWIKLAMHFFRGLEVTELSSFFGAANVSLALAGSWGVRRSDEPLTELASAWISYHGHF